LNDTVRLSDPKIGGQVKTVRYYLIRGPSYTALKSP